MYVPLRSTYQYHFPTESDRPLLESASAPFSSLTADQILESSPPTEESTAIYRIISKQSDETPVAFTFHVSIKARKFLIFNTIVLLSENAVYYKKEFIDIVTELLFFDRMVNPWGADTFMVLINENYDANHILKEAIWEDPYGITSPPGYRFQLCRLEDIKQAHG